MKKMKKKQFKALMDEYDTIAPPIEELSGYDRVDAWIEWLKLRLECPTIEQLEVRMGMTILK
jgi:hypothetical protein